MSILIVSTNGDSVPISTLEKARTEAHVSGKTVVVTSALTQAQSNIVADWPTDRTLKIDQGGRIANSTTFTVNGTFDAGKSQCFTGAGRVYINSQPPKPIWFGMDGVDDGVAVRKAIIATRYNPSKSVEFGGLNYKITSTCFFESGTKLLGQNSLITGAGYAASSAPIFEVGYYSGDNLVTLIGQPDEGVNRHVNSEIRNFRFTLTGIAINSFNMNEGCAIEYIYGFKCWQLLVADRSFYCKTSDITYRGKNDPSDGHTVNDFTDDPTAPAIQLFDFVNVEMLTNISINQRYVAMSIENGTNGQKLQNCSFENCYVGLVVDGEMNGLSIDSCYFEKLDKGLQFQRGSKSNVTITNTWFDFIDTVCVYSDKDTLPAAAMLSGFIGNNAFGANVNAGIVDIQDDNSTITVVIPETNRITTTASAYPIGYLLGKRINVQYNDTIYSNATGFPLVKSEFTGNILPMYYEGNSGSVPSAVPYCAVGSIAVVNPTTCVIDTKIGSGDYNFVVFRLELVDNSGASALCGRVYTARYTTAVVSRDDAFSATKTITVSNNGGFLRFTVGGINNGGGGSSIEGIIRHM